MLILAKAFDFFNNLLQIYWCNFRECSQKNLIQESENLKQI